MKWSATLWGAAALAWVSPAHAEQCVDFSLANISSATASYNPFDPLDSAGDVLILARRTNPAVAYVRFLLADPTPGPGGPQLGAGGPARYEIQWIEDPSRRVLAAPGEEPTAFLAATAGFDGANDMATELLRLIIPRGQEMAPGTTAERLDVAFACVGTDGEVIERGLQPSRIRVRARHAPNFSVYIASVGSRQGVLDLGELDVDAGVTTGRTGVTVLSSLPYEMRISSSNNFNLRREGEEPDLIPYAVTVDDAPVDGRGQLLCPATPPPLGQTIDVDVAVPGPLRAHRAGAYRDVITLSFSARDTGTPGPSCAAN